MSASENNKPSQSGAAGRPNTANPEKAKPKQRGWVFILIAVAIMIIIMFKESRKSIDWLDDYEVGIKQARQQDKPALILFVSSDTAYADTCKRMKSETYSKAEITKQVTENFVPILLDHNQNKQLVEKYNITTFPTQIIIFPDKDNSASIEGFVTATEFAGRLKRARQRLTQ